MILGIVIFLIQEFTPLKEWENLELYKAIRYVIFQYGEKEL
jgi:hypothetical protein